MEDSFSLKTIRLIRRNGLQCDAVRPVCSACRLRNIKCEYDTEDHGDTRTKARMRKIEDLCLQVDSLKQKVQGLQSQIAEYQSSQQPTFHGEQPSPPPSSTMSTSAADSSSLKSMLSSGNLHSTDSASDPTGSGTLRTAPSCLSEMSGTSIGSQDEYMTSTRYALRLTFTACRRYRHDCA